MVFQAAHFITSVTKVLPWAVSVLVHGVLLALASLWALTPAHNTPVPPVKLTVLLPQPAAAQQSAAPRESPTPLDSKKRNTAIALSMPTPIPVKPAEANQVSVPSPTVVQPPERPLMPASTAQSNGSQVTPAVVLSPASNQTQVPAMTTNGAVATTNKSVAITAQSSEISLADFKAANFKAAYLQNPEPNYPTMSRRLGEAGTVYLWVLVNPAGKVDDLGVLKTSGYPRLDDAALKTVRSWRFTPAKRGSEPVSDKVSVPIVFSL